MTQETLHKRAQMVRSMEMIMRALNDEDYFAAWLMVGVADGDINGEETDDDLEYYCRDKNFADLMATFCRIMRRANNDPDIEKCDREKGNCILYFDGVISKYDEEE